MLTYFSDGNANPNPFPPGEDPHNSPQQRPIFIVRNYRALNPHSPSDVFFLTRSKYKAGLYLYIPIIYTYIHITIYYILFGTHVICASFFLRDVGVLMDFSDFSITPQPLGMTAKGACQEPLPGRPRPRPRPTHCICVMCPGGRLWDGTNPPRDPLIGPSFMG